MKMLETLDGTGAVLRPPDGGNFHALLPGVPRTGEVVWHLHPRRNSKPKKFVVEHVEWWNTQPDIRFEVFLVDAP